MALVESGSRKLDYMDLVAALGVNLGGVMFRGENKSIYELMLTQDYGYKVNLEGFTYRTFDSVMDITDSTGSTGYVLVGAHEIDRDNEAKMREVREIYLENGRVPIKSYTTFDSDGKSSHSGFCWEREELIKERQEFSGLAI